MQKIYSQLKFENSLHHESSKYNKVKTVILGGKYKLSLQVTMFWLMRAELFTSHSYPLKVE